MTRHPNYYPDHFRGQIVYRCCVCKFDTFQEENVRFHALLHPKVMLPDISDCFQVQVPMRKLRVVIGVITSESDWPTNSVHIASQEARLLQQYGVDADVCWVDNGSSYYPSGQQIDLEGVTVHNQINLGQSIARNIIIDRALTENAHYLLMVDGDIELIPYSGLAMINILEGSHDVHIGCVGMFSRNCTKDRLDGVSSCCVTIPWPLLDYPVEAWTQYGMFNVNMFRDGLRFDTSECFQGQGWGFEDTDLACQMLATGWKTLNTPYFRYAHLSLNSSLRFMDPTLAAKVFNARRQYVYNKWIGNPLVRNRAELLANSTMPVLL